MNLPAVRDEIKMGIGFELIVKDVLSKARRGRLTTRRGVIETPVFMPVGTQGSVKGLTSTEVDDLGAAIILANTYHLMLRPGDALIAQFGGLHRFISWNGSILTDSGGFQVFSLANSRKVEEDGVRFQSHLDGETIFLTPERVIEIQSNLGSDIMMVLDECLSYETPRSAIMPSIERTVRWAIRCKAARRDTTQGLFGIVQGVTQADYRRRCAERLLEIGFDGYAMGGLSVGEPKTEMIEMVDHDTDQLPDDRPRYLMGVGAPEDLVNAVDRGIDMFDCVLPTRNARNGHLFTSFGHIQIRDAIHRTSDEPIDDRCPCYTCQTYSRGYLRHLFHAKEITSSRLNTIHNLHFYLTLMQSMRDAIEHGRWKSFKAEFFSKRQH